MRQCLFYEVHGDRGELIVLVQNAYPHTHCRDAPEGQRGSAYLRPFGEVNPSFVGGPPTFSELPYDLFYLLTLIQ